MLHASTQKLILKLCDLTDRGEAPWREGDGDTSWFDTEGYRIEVKPEPPGIRVMQAGGREVESADADQLGSAVFPGEPGKTYADRVRRMGMDARRLARGAEKAITTILSALSSPPAVEPEAANFSTTGGAESEAAMAAAVADMALRLKHQQLEYGIEAPPHAAAEVGKEIAAPVQPATSASRPAPRRPMFGEIVSFAAARRFATGDVATLAANSAPPEPQPKLSPQGLVVTGFHAVTVQTPETSHPPQPKPSSAGYRPWT